MTAVDRYAMACKDIEMQFVKHPATWLAAGCWDDEDLPASKQTKFPWKGMEGIV